jgi:hypothetical protein
LSLRSGLLLPRGLWAVARAAHRAQPSDPPARATEQAHPSVRTLAVPLPHTRRSVGASVSTRRSGRSVPARSGAMAPTARGAHFTPTLPCAVDLLGSFRQAGCVVSEIRPTVLWVGGSKSAGAAGGESLRSPRAPDARGALGKRRRGFMRTLRGPDADRALRSRAEECAADAAGETQGRTQPLAGPARRNPWSGNREWKEETMCVRLACRVGRRGSGVRLSPWCKLAGQLLRVRPSGNHPAAAGPGRAEVLARPCAFGGDV